jgi:hypothetical protein
VSTSDPRAAALIGGAKSKRLVWITALCFGFFAVAQVVLPLGSSALHNSPFCAASRFVHYPPEEVSSGTFETSSVSVLQFAAEHLSRLFQLSLTEAGQGLDPAPRIFTFFHRRTFSSTSDDDHH